jgi:hypothetical protein
LTKLDITGIMLVDASARLQAVASSGEHADLMMLRIGRLPPNPALLLLTSRSKGS